MNCGRSGRWCSEVLFRRLVLVGLILFLWVGILENEAATLNSEVAGGSWKHMELIGKRLLNAHKHLEINFVSKRRVPNGPDPIHNRLIALVEFTYSDCILVICMLSIFVS